MLLCLYNKGIVWRSLTRIGNAYRISVAYARYQACLSYQAGLYDGTNMIRQDDIRRAYRGRGVYPLFAYTWHLQMGHTY
jgi:hypothetical protein